jgi:hypothetical protein
MVCCQLCGTEYDNKTASTVPPCPACFKIAVNSPDIYKWVKQVFEKTEYDAGAALYRHNKHQKHEANKHYSGF